MPAELVLTVLQESSEDLGAIAGLAITDVLLVAAGGGTVLASSNGRHFEPRGTPEGGLRDILVTGDAWWVCGEAGRLAVSHDRGASWQVIETGTTVCLTGLAGSDAVWVVGDEGYAARVVDGVAQRIEVGTSVSLSSVYAVRDAVVMLGVDGQLRRWCDGAVTTIATGSTRPLNALALSRVGTWIVIGDGGFVARSPDGSWFSRGASGTEVDLEAIATLADGRLVMAGDRGGILTSADDGRTWRAVPSPLTAHLWSAEPFGAGAVIGGDRGVIVKLAPVDDPTWRDRGNQFGAPLPLDACFARGPMGFIAGGLAAYLGVEPTEVDPASFVERYGMPMPAEAARLFAIAGPGFAELELEVPRRGDGNLFESLLAGACPVEAFCGVFRFARGYYLEVYPWDGPRQVLQFDPEAGTFPQIVADSLDSQIFLIAIGKAREAGLISHDAYATGMRKLRSRVASVGARDPGFVAYEPKRRDTEFFFHRARWITALLTNRDLAEVRALFRADFNHVIEADQLPARYEAFERFIPTALYALWRAYLFDEPELARYLELARGHRARLVRDAAQLIDELRGGRMVLGAIRDVAAWLSAFRGLGLDPRRVAETSQRERVVTARHQAVVAELELTAPDARAEHAWRWLDDGVAHRALLELLDRTPHGAAQIAALEALCGMREAERVLALPRLAAALSAELEAVLVGSVVRDDPMTDVLPRESAEVITPGWTAIDRALEPLYHGQEPMHFGTVMPYSQGGGDPIHGISVYPRSEPVPHFHLVTYGFTDLFAKETDDPDVSGFGFELTLRVARGIDEASAPLWALSFLQSLGRYVFGTGNRFAAGHKMGLNAPICADAPTQITAICFTDDPELGDITSELGKARFVQVVGITEDEYRLIQEWSTAGLLEILEERLPVLVTDLERPSVLDDPEVAAEVHRRVTEEGSSEDLTFGGELTVGVDDGQIHIELGALYALALPRAMRGRILHGRDYRLRGGEAGSYRFAAWSQLQITVTPSFIRSADGTSFIDVRGIADRVEARRLVDAENARIAAADEDPDDEVDVPPNPARVQAALAMTARALRLAPADRDLQFTHAMLLLDGDRAGLAACADDLLAVLPSFAASVRINVAARLGARAHPQFASVVDLALAGSAEALDEVTYELFLELGQAILALAADRMIRFVPRLPDELELLGELAGDAVAADQQDAAIALFDRLLALAIPDAGEERADHLRALNNACIQAHAVKAFDSAVRIANRAQPVAHENPYIYHSAACAYAAVGDYAKALEQVRLAVEHGYDHLGKVEVDRDLGPLLEWPEFKRLFRDWRAREEGN